VRGAASMTDARVDDPARGNWARCAPLVATPPVFPGPGGYGLTARLLSKRSILDVCADFRTRPLPGSRLGNGEKSIWIDVHVLGEMIIIYASPNVIGRFLVFHDNHLVATSIIGQIIIKRLLHVIRHLFLR
jgi:hypothetical protein